MPYTWGLLIIELIGNMNIWLKRILRLISFGFFTCLLLVFLFVGAVIFYLEKELPDVAVLNKVQLQVPLRIFTSDGKLIGEYGKKKRIPVQFERIPKQLINAVLATEDQRFFEHPGVDVLGLMRASIQVVTTGSKSQGGSTITMQVARNFFLTRKKTYIRKLKEILLAIKIDNELSKEKILDLYLNSIYFGNRAYGVGAAAQVYYGKPLEELNLAQLAMIAGLPKAPSALNPIRDPIAAKKRRNHVLKRMQEQNYITKIEYEEALNTPITVHHHPQAIASYAPYVAEMVRTTLVNYYGEDAYTRGLNVYTTVNSNTAKKANYALRKTLLDYDKRHGYRGPIENLGTPSLEKLPTWLAKLKKIPVVNELLPAAIISVHENKATAVVANGEVLIISWDGLSWARKALAENGLGPRPKTASDILKPGDVIRVDKTESGMWNLAQIPEAEGALVAINPYNGAIEALVGGFDYKQSNFNRVTQAKRQAGSSFKPFIYAAALERGFTLASIINDAPLVLNDPAQSDYWRPQNYTKRFYGPTRLRTGLVKSRNLVSIRLLDAIGIPYALDYLTNFGFDKKQLPHSLSLALGTGTLTPLELASSYALFANGGYRVKPYIIDYITNEKGEIIYKAKPRTACKTCITDERVIDIKELENYAPKAISPQVSYLMNSVLQEVITQGTGRPIYNLGLIRKDIAGKTGSTNDQKDAWFAGYSPDLVTVAWVGFDQPRSLYEYGSQAALPMWTEFMKIALQGKPEVVMQQPPGLISMRIDPRTGKPAESWQKDAIYELFREGHTPSKQHTTNKTQASSAINTYEGNNEDEEDEAMHLF